MPDLAWRADRNKSWRDSFLAFLHPRVITMLFMGFSAGLPILVLFTPLSAWFSEAGVAKSTIGFFSWAALGYSFKFIWAPIVDSLPLPVLSRLIGRRRSWLLVSQLMIMLAILLSGLTDPLAENGLFIFAVFTVFLGFSSATQDIVIDAYRIDSAGDDLQAMMAAAYIGGYRVGMLVAGAGSLTLAQLLGSGKEEYLYEAWMWTYVVLAAFMSVGLVTTLIVKEPESRQAYRPDFRRKSDYLRFLLVFLIVVGGFVLTYSLTGSLAGAIKDFLVSDLAMNDIFGGFVAAGCRLILAFLVMAISGWLVWQVNFVPRQLIQQSYMVPFTDFFQRFGRQALVILVLISLYKISDIVLGVMSNPFYLELGFSKLEIASISKGFGLVMTILGGFLGGVCCVRYGILKILFLGAILSASTNLLFALLAVAGKDINLLTVVIAADNLSAGLAGAAFVAYLSSLTNRAFSATQYALFSSIMTLFPKLVAGYSGVWVENFGWSPFFLITACMGVPVMLLILAIARRTAPAMMPSEKERF